MQKYWGNGPKDLTKPTAVFCSRLPNYLGTYPGSCITQGWPIYVQELPVQSSRQHTQDKCNRPTRFYQKTQLNQCINRFFAYEKSRLTEWYSPNKSVYQTDHII